MSTTEVGVSRGNSVPDRGRADAARHVWILLAVLGVAGLLAGVMALAKRSALDREIADSDLFLSQPAKDGARFSGWSSHGMCSHRQSDLGGFDSLMALLGDQSV